ncbi:MAG: hypothetical protein GOMPHAMPRED_000728 [Gomphillus americanus]|uniref:Uncharacterized protein n=1 Tax=Gomphillus americanus TaxID=1940652 RepID=A0A8H3EZJ0_9LECA|nr:MAG: hypothetical protein GOMPHAMPRED_000728 [Gomphillus americanus]
MQMNKATVLAILAFTTSALAQYEQYSYGSDIYAREAEPEFDDDYSLYAREAEADEEEFSQLSAREEAYLAGYVHGLAGRDVTAAQKTALNNLASGEKAQAANLNKQGDDQAHKAKHDKLVADADKAKVTNDKSQLDALFAQMKTLEEKMVKDKARYIARRKKAEEESKNASKLKGQAGKLKSDAQALSARELLEQYYDLGYDFDY